MGLERLVALTDTFISIYHTEIWQGGVYEGNLKCYTGDVESKVRQRVGDKLFGLAILESLPLHLSPDAQVQIIGTNQGMRTSLCDLEVSVGSRIHALHITDTSGLDIVIDLGGIGGTRMRDNFHNEYLSSTSAASNAAEFLSKANQFIIFLARETFPYGNEVRLMLNNRHCANLVATGDLSRCIAFRTAFCETVLEKFSDKLSYYPHGFDRKPNYIYCDYHQALAQVQSTFQDKAVEYRAPKKENTAEMVVKDVDSIDDIANQQTTRRETNNWLNFCCCFGARKHDDDDHDKTADLHVKQSTV